MHRDIKYKFLEVGSNITIYEPVSIIKPEIFTLKSNIIISEFSYLAGGLGIFVGNHIHIAAHTCISGGGYCFLDDFCGLSAGVRIITGSAEINGSGLTSPTLPKNFQDVYRSYVYIGKHALLSTNVIVHPGVIIGEGAVVGSGSVVTKNVDPWSIYMGIPAKKVKERPREKILEMEKEIYKSQNLTPSLIGKIAEQIIAKHK